MNGRPLLLLLLFLLTLPLFAGVTPARVVLVSLQGISLNDLQSIHDSNYQQILARGAIGLMNNRTSVGLGYESNAVTVGAGTRAAGAELQPDGTTITFGDYGWQSNELVSGVRARTIYFRYTGQRMHDAAIVHTGIAALQRINSTQQYSVTPGLLGEVLKDAGVKVSIYGNSDQRGRPGRSAVAIAMDKQGLVPTGDVTKNMLLIDQQRPSGVRTNYSLMLQKVAELSSGANFVVIETGDGKRLDRATDWMSDKRYRILKNKLLRDTGKFVLQLDEELRSDGKPYLLIIAVLENDSRALAHGDELTPLLLVGSGIAPGLLTTKTTRYPGLVVNYDLTTTILQAFSLPPAMGMLGFPISSIPDTKPLTTLMKMNSQMITSNLVRLPILRVYIISLVIILVVSVMSMIYVMHLAKPLRGIFQARFLRIALTAVLIAPMAFLIAPGLGIFNKLPLSIFLIAFSVISAVILNRFSRDLRILFAIIGLSTSLLLAIDLLIGCPLAKKSVFSYSPVAGFRFYGIGNQYSGVFFGATLLGCFSLLDYYSHIKHFLLLPVLAYAVITFIIIGAPDFGADFGGMVTAIPAFGYSLAHVYGTKSWRRWLPGIALGILLLFVLLLAMNVAQQTHIGRALADASSEGVGVLREIAIRKWQMNLRLIQYSLWAYVLISLAIGIAVISSRPISLVRNAVQQYPILNAGLVGIFIGMMVAFLVNDTGVVMAATGILFLTLPMLLLVLRDLTDRKDDPTPLSPSVNTLLPNPATDGEEIA